MADGDQPHLIHAIGETAHDAAARDASLTALPQPHVLDAAAELFRALAAPARLAILSRLALAPARVHEVVEATGLAQPLVSQHLKVLREAHLVVGVRTGREITYRMADDHVGHVVRDALAHVDEGPTP